MTYDRFMVWESEQFYPGGGLSDFVGSFKTLEEARAFAKKLNDKDIGNWIGIFDRIEGVEVEPEAPRQERASDGV